MGISFLFKFRLVFAAAVMIFLTVSAFAQIAQQVIFTFVNGASPVSNLTLFIFFPEQIQPVNLSARNSNSECGDQPSRV